MITLIIDFNMKVAPDFSTKEYELKMQLGMTEMGCSMTKQQRPCLICGLQSMSEEKQYEKLSMKKEKPKIGCRSNSTEVIY